LLFKVALFFFSPKTKKMGVFAFFSPPLPLGTLKHFMEQLQWATNFDGRQQMLQGLKEIGSVIFWMSLLDTAMVRLLPY
jgi:hypothetical protein